MPPGSSRWPNWPTTPSCSGSIRAAAASFRSTLSTWRAGCAASCGSRFSRSAATAPSKTSSAAAPRRAKRGRTPGSMTRSCGSTQHSSREVRRTASSAGRGGELVGGLVRRLARRGVFRREHVQPRERGEQGGAGSSGRAAAPRRLPPARYPVPDTAFGAFRRHRNQPPALSSTARRGPLLPRGLPLGLARVVPAATRSPPLHSSTLTS